jgi:hypothetical protein
MRDGGKYRGTHPARRCHCRIPQTFRDHRKAACACELNDGCFAIAEEDPIGIDVWSQWSRSAEREMFPTRGCRKDVRCAITAIRDWDACNDICGPDGAPGCVDGFCY